MSYGEIWPETDEALELAANHNWRALERVGGPKAAFYRCRIGKQHELAELARARDDHAKASKHSEEAERLYEELEEHLARNRAH